MNDQFIHKKLSVIVPVCERTENTTAIYKEYKEFCKELSGSVEFIYIVTTEHSATAEELRSIQETDEDLTLILLNRNYGEATAIQTGFLHANGDYILTLPPYKQVENADLIKLFNGIGLTICIG